MVTPRSTPLSVMGWISWFVLLNLDVPRWFAYFVCIPIITVSIAVWNIMDIKNR